MAKDVVAKGWSLPVVDGRRYSTVTEASALALACAAIAPGDSASFEQGNNHGLEDGGVDYVQYRLDWNGRFFHDRVNGLVHLLGKSASGQGGDIDWCHRIYHIALGLWTNHDESIRQFNRAGHIYAGFDIEELTGDLYATPGTGAIDIWRWQFSTMTWTQIVADYRTTGVNNPPSGLAVHPHLFGTDQMGVVISSATDGNNYSIFTWRKSNGALLRIVLGYSLSNNTSPNASSHGSYFAGANAVIIGRERHTLVTPGTPPICTDVGDPPIRTMGTNAGNTHGVMLPHPADATRHLLLSKISPFDYWDTLDGNAWTHRGTHPLTVTANNPKTFCSLRGGYGCIWGIGKASGPTKVSLLWRPVVV